MTDLTAPRSALTARMVLIDWERSTEPTTAWESAEDIYTAELDQCFSVGWIIRDDWDTTVLAASVAGLGEGEDMQLSWVIRIPTGSIRSVRVLGVEG